MGKLAVDVEVKSPADKFWGGIKESTSSLKSSLSNTKALKSLKVMESMQALTVRLVKFAEGIYTYVLFSEKYIGIPIITFLKEKIEATDEVKKSVTYSVVDGEMTDLYKNFKGSLQVVPKGDGSLVKWSAEFEKASEELPDPDNIQELVIKALTALDAYLLKA